MESSFQKTFCVQEIQPLPQQTHVAYSKDNLTIMFDDIGGVHNWSTFKGNVPLLDGIWYWEIIVEKFSKGDGNSWYIVVGLVPEYPKVCERCLGDCYCLIFGTGKIITNCSGGGNPYYNDEIKEGDVIGVHYDSKLGHLSFFINGKHYGLAFGSIQGKMFPYVGITACDARLAVKLNPQKWLSLTLPQNSLEAPMLLQLPQNPL